MVPMFALAMAAGENANFTAFAGAVFTRNRRSVPDAYGKRVGLAEEAKRASIFSNPVAGAEPATRPPLPLSQVSAL